MRLIILATTLLALAPATSRKRTGQEARPVQGQWRHGLPEPPSAASKRREWPARPGEMWNSRPTESLPSAAAQALQTYPANRRQHDRTQWDKGGGGADPQ